MRLADFIEANRDLLLAEWEAFASTREGAEHMDRAALRDHAGSLLREICADLRTPQSPAEAEDKAHGHSDSPDTAPDSAAQAHGEERAHGGFSISEMVSEFRALRASVLRHWTAHTGNLSGTDLADLMRFNESIDQTLSESVTRFTDSIAESKDLFLAILSHDLRAPLQTVLMVNEHLAAAPSRDTTQTVLVSRATRSVTRMIELVDDLLDFTRSRMGAGLGIVLAPTDLSTVIRDAVEEVEAAHPQWAFEAHIEPELRASVDSARLQQVLANLLSNAVHHGDSSLPVTVRAHGTDRDVVIEVGNFGRAIPAADMSSLFSPFKRILDNAPPTSADHHLGLGLYITDRIVTAHHGRIDVTSSKEDGTKFRVTLPR
ncbi:ATP-binding protein [Gemmatimonas sp.]|uniref:ATP-binding protein n=1 Tax=Gemmatimonas sp. TaxID=1962908 RepID=UPI00398394D0